MSCIKRWRRAILKLQTEAGLLMGYTACACIGWACIHRCWQQNWLNRPTSTRVLEVVSASNLYAAPGTDGLPSQLYKECWNVLGNPLTEVMSEIFEEKALRPSMRTSSMVFGSKPKNLKSILPRDKRKISLLNADFKIATGLEAEIFICGHQHTLISLTCGRKWQKNPSWNQHG